MNPQCLFLLYIHKSLTDSLGFEAVARDFASTNTRRINYFAQGRRQDFEEGGAELKGCEAPETT